MSEVKDIVSALRDLQAEKWVDPFMAGGVTVFPQGTGSHWLTLRRGRASVSGKHLFFAADPAELIDAAVSELRAGRHVSAKVSVHPHPITVTHCLCLYSAADVGGAELAARYPHLLYRGWKSDADTRAGKYSDLHRAAFGASVRARV